MTLTAWITGLDKALYMVYLNSLIKSKLRKYDILLVRSTRFITLSGRNAKDCANKIRCWSM